MSSVRSSRLGSDHAGQGIAEESRPSAICEEHGVSQRGQEGLGSTGLQPSRAWTPHSAAVHEQPPPRFLKRNQALRRGVGRQRLLAAVTLT